MALFLVNKIEDLIVLDNIDEEVYYNIDFKTYDLKDIDAIMKRFEIIKTAPYDIKVSINAYNRNFDNLDFAFFLTLSKKLSALGIDLRFSQDHHSDYTLEELMKADEILDNFINSINTDELSPLEKYFDIYNFLTKKKYKENDDWDKKYMSRDVISVMNSEYIVCEGFANLMTYLCKNVGISCFVQVLSLGNNTNDLHANNLVYIDDDKYDIHGLYYSDVTWDAATSYDWSKSYNFFLLTLEDAKNINIAIDVFPFFRLFYNQDTALIRVTDSDLSFVGTNLCYMPPYYSSYFPSYAEIVLDISDLVEKSYKTAINYYLNNYVEAINKVKEIFIKKNVPFDAYRQTNLMQVPFGSTLVYLVAILCFNPSATSMVEKGIDRLIKHIEKPLNNPDEIFSGEPLPSYQTANIYVSLDSLLLMKEEDIDLSYEELDRRAIENYYPFSPLDEDIEKSITQKNTYTTLLGIINRIRNIILFKPICQIIKEDYPKGEAIPLDVLIKAMHKAFTYLGDKDNDCTQMVYDSLINTHTNMQASLNNKVTNSIYHIADLNNLDTFVNDVIKKRS